MKFQKYLAWTVLIGLIILTFLSTEHFVSGQFWLIGCLLLIYSYLALRYF